MFLLNLELYLHLKSIKIRADLTPVTKTTLDDTNIELSNKE